MHAYSDILASLPLAWNLGMQEIIVLGIFGLLIFGKRLPEVGKSLGKSIVEFKKGLHGIEDEINNSSTNSSTGTPDMLPPPKPQNQTPTPTETRPEPNSVPRT